MIDASPYWNKLKPYVVSQVNDYDKQDNWHHGCEDGGKGYLVAEWHEWMQIAIGFTNMYENRSENRSNCVGLNV